MIKNCLICNEKFYTRPWNADNSHYCSRKCRDDARRTRVKKICKICKKIYFVKKSHENRSKYCSKKCQGIGKQRETWPEGVDNKNYKTGIRSYSKKAIELFGYNCQICGYDKRIMTHHIDGNRFNNPPDGSNWLRVCYRCHHKIHLLSDPFLYHPNKLKPSA